MSWQMVIIKILGGIITVASIMLMLYLIKVIDRFDLIAVLHMAVPVITFPAGIGMLVFLREED